MSTMPAVPSAPAPAARGNLARSRGAGAVALLILGAMAAVVAAIALVTGASLLVLDRTGRDADGFVMTEFAPHAASGHAIVTERFSAGGAGDVPFVRDLLGTARVRVRSARPVFAAVGPAAAVDAYLRGVGRAEVPAFADRHAEARTVAGGAPAAAPGSLRFWTTSTAGTGTRALSWRPLAGDTRIVLMDARGKAGVRADVSVGARFPHLLAVALGLVGAAAVSGALAVALVWRGVRRAGGAEVRGQARTHP